MTGAIVYVICHDTESYTAARRIARDRDYMRVIQMPTTKYFDNFLFLKLLGPLCHEWEDKRYVGAVHYNCDKFVDPRTNRPILQALDEIVVNDKYDKEADVYAFYPLSNIHHRYDEHRKFGFKVAWGLLHFLANGMSSSEQVFVNKPYFYRNYWMCRPEIMKRYIAFVRNCDAVIENNPPLYKIMHVVDTEYALYKSESLLDHMQRCTGLRGVSILAFVFERLPAFFCHTNNIKVYGLDNTLLP